MMCEKHGDNVINWNDVLSVILKNAPPPPPPPPPPPLDLIIFEISGGF